MLENVGNAITRLPMDRYGRNSGGHIPSCIRHVHHDAVATATAVGNGRCLASSYGRLEAERANQF